MPLKPIILCLFLCLFYSKGQEITVINSSNKNPIDHVFIFNTSGKYLGKTDLDGKFEKKHIESLTGFVLLHPTIKTSTLNLSDIIHDVIAVQQIREQPITKIYKNNADKEYMIIKGFFTIYNTADGILSRYTDGIIQYRFDQRTNTYKDYIIEEYRNFRYKDRNVAGNTSVFNFTGITQFPILDNLNSLKELKKHPYKNFNSIKNQLVIRKSNDSLPNENSKKFLGYLLKNFNYDILYKFSGTKTDFFELSNFCKTVKLDAKHKKQNSFTTYTSTANFYPLEIRYLNKNEIEKGVKLNSNKSKYTTNYWQNDYFSYLIDYLSQRSLYDIGLMKNQK